MNLLESKSGHVAFYGFDGLASCDWGRHNWLNIDYFTLFVNRGDLKDAYFLGILKQYGKHCYSDAQ